MKTQLFAALAAALLTSPLALADSSAPSRDPAAELLRRQGSLTIAAAGPHVSPGTFRVQVAAKLGSPDLTLADGTWLYRGRRIEGSAARGTLVVRFTEGRVQSLAVVTDAVVAALRADPSGRAAKDLLATR